MLSSNRLLKQLQGSVYRQPMNAKIGMKASFTAWYIIIISVDMTMFWKVKHRDGGESAIGPLQLLSDKPHFSMSAPSLILYSLRKILLYFNEEVHRNYIFPIKTIFVHIPVRFDVDHFSPSGMPCKIREGTENDCKCSRVAILETF